MKIFFFSGISYYVRQVAKCMPNTVTLEKHNKEYSIINRTPVNINSTLKFVPGETIKYTTQDGRKVESILTIEKNVIHEIQTQPSGLVLYNERIFTEDRLILVNNINKNINIIINIILLFFYIFFSIRIADQTT